MKKTICLLMLFISSTQAGVIAIMPDNESYNFKHYFANEFDDTLKISFDYGRAFDEGAIKGCDVSILVGKKILALGIENAKNGRAILTPIPMQYAKLINNQTMIKIKLEGQRIGVKKFVFNNKKVTQIQRIINEKPLTEQEITENKARKDAIEKKGENLFSVWDGSQPEMVRKTKSQMKNPKSFKHVKTKYLLQNGKVLVIMVFRGTNSFGAVATNTAYGFVNHNTRQVTEFMIK